jgi:hypothetical protein
MFARLAEQYRAVVQDLVMSLQALATCLRERGQVATCYLCGDGSENPGASFVAAIDDNHMVRFLVSDFGISWVESRNGQELVKLEGADAIRELQRLADGLKTPDGVDVPAFASAFAGPDPAEPGGSEPAPSAPVPLHGSVQRARAA